MNEVDPELGSMASRGVGNVVFELVLLLIAEHGKRGDRSDELLVTIGLEAGDCLRGGTKWKCQRKTQIAIASGRSMQVACIKREGPQPARRERVLIA